MFKQKNLFILALASLLVAGLAGCDFLFDDGSPADDDDDGGTTTEMQVDVAENDTLGTYLTDGEGRSLYLFTDENGNPVPCTGQCAGVWPPFTAEGEVAAGGGADASLLSTTERPDGSMQVVYNGWPLYFFANDQGPGDVNGQGIHSFGGEWYLISPAGEEVEAEGGESSMTFTVTVEEKMEEHPHFGEGFPEGFVVDGEQGKALTLTRGETYIFQMEDVPSLHPFYLTTDERGLGSGELTEGVSDNQQLTFTPTASTPNTIYYNCVTHAFMGYRITVE